MSCREMRRCDVGSPWLGGSWLRCVALEEGANHREGREGGKEERREGGTVGIHFCAWLSLDTSSHHTAVPLGAWRFSFASARLSSRLTLAGMVARNSSFYGRRKNGETGASKSGRVEYIPGPQL